MTTRYLFRNPDGDLEEFTDRCRLYRLSAMEQAEEGQPATWTLVVDDPLGDFDIPAHRVVAIYEDEYPGDDKFIAIGYVQSRIFRRGPYRTGAAREIEFTIADVNTVLSRRAVQDSMSPNRPAETDVERIQWWEASGAATLIDDTRYLSTAVPVDLDARDYTNEKGDTIISEVITVSTKNIFITYFYDAGADDPWGFYSMWYGFGDTTDYRSSIRISNDLEDLDFGTSPRVTFEPTLDSEQDRDGQRVASRVIVPYAGGVAIFNNPATETAFALSGKDEVMSSLEIKNGGVAAAKAAAQQAQLSTEEDVLKVSIYVPRDQVNDVRPGMAIETKLTYSQDYRDFTWMRVLNRTVSQEESEQLYKLTMELAPPTVRPTIPLEATMAIGSADHFGGVERIERISSDEGASPYPLVTGKEYRIVATVVAAENVGGGLTYAGGGCDGMPREYDIIDGMEVRLTVTGTTTKIGAPTYGWDPNDITSDATHAGDGIGWVYGGTPGTDYACGLPAYRPGQTFTTDWLEFEGPDVDADLCIVGTGISGFYGFYINVHVALEER